MCSIIFYHEELRKSMGVYMKSDRNILVAFILNLLFSVFEFAGGIITGSVALSSDAVHDMGDAVSIGISYFMERKSKKDPDEKYTYGYLRYSVLGALISTVILLVGSAIMIYSAAARIIEPKEINYDGMILFAAVGVCVNLCAAVFTRGEGTLNQKAVNLHMLEDVLGWIVVFIGSLVIRFTGLSLIDPIMSAGVSTYIIIHAMGNLGQILELLLEKVPHGIDVEDIRERLLKVRGVVDVHHVHVWSLDGHSGLATMHVVCDGEAHEIKDAVRDTLRKVGIDHVTVEIEDVTEYCSEIKCNVKSIHNGHCHHHH